MDLHDLIAVSERVPSSVGAAWGVVVGGGLVAVVLAFVRAHAVRSIVRGVPPDTVVVARFGHRGPQAVLVARTSTAGRDADGERFADWKDFVGARHEDLWRFTRIRARVSDLPAHQILDLRHPKRRNDQLNQRAGPLDETRDDRVTTGRSAEDDVIAAEDDRSAAEDVRWLYGAIEQLPKRQREVVIMLQLQGMSTAEVADALEIGSGAVRAAKLKGPAIAVFFAIAQTVGSLAPLLYGALIDTTSRTSLCIGFLCGAACMLLGAAVARLIAVDAENKPLEAVAAPFAVEAARDAVATRPARP